MDDPAFAKTRPDRAELRAVAVSRVRKRRDLETHLLVYLIVNTLFIAIWLTTSTGFFWPVFLMAGWGIGLLINVGVMWRGDHLDEREVEREMARLRRGARPTDEMKPIER